MLVILKMERWMDMEKKYYSSHPYHLQYEGDFKDNKKEGNGKYYHHDDGKLEFVGHLKTMLQMVGENYMEKEGNLEFQNYVNNQRTGYGTLFRRNGSKEYKGHYLKEKKKDTVKDMI